MDLSKSVGGVRLDEGIQFLSWLSCREMKAFYAPNQIMKKQKARNCTENEILVCTLQFECS